MKFKENSKSPKNAPKILRYPSAYLPHGPPSFLSFGNFRGIEDEHEVEFLQKIIVFCG
jgi:hypothetical protein